MELFDAEVNTAFLSVNRWEVEAAEEGRGTATQYTKTEKLAIAKKWVEQLDARVQEDVNHDRITYVRDEPGKA